VADWDPHIGVIIAMCGTVESGATIDARQVVRARELDEGYVRGQRQDDPDVVIALMRQVVSNAALSVG
jgi:hypothetical protein